MMAVVNKIRINIKNNIWREGSFPNTPEGEKVFAITKERFHEALVKFPNLKDRIESLIDWDENNFKTSMATTDILLTWNFPSSNLKKVAPNLKWIHCISAGIEHLLPLDWMFEELVLTNNSGVHSKKAGEYGLMSVLMLHNHIPKIVSNKKDKNLENFWLIDPIDGTESYINNRDEFTLNAALIINKKPLIGIINAPDKNRLFYSYGQLNSYEVVEGKKIKLSEKKKNKSSETKAGSY